MRAPQRVRIDFEDSHVPSQSSLSWWPKAAQDPTRLRWSIVKSRWALLSEPESAKASSNAQGSKQVRWALVNRWQCGETLRPTTLALLDPPPAKTKHEGAQVAGKAKAQRELKWDSENLPRPVMSCLILTLMALQWRTQRA